MTSALILEPEVQERPEPVEHHLKLKTTLPAKKVALTVTENKEQLIQIILEELCKDRLFHTDYTKKHKLVITGEKNCPVEIQNEEIRMRHDLATNHEEADNIIVQQMQSRREIHHSGV